MRPSFSLQSQLASAFDIRNSEHAVCCQLAVLVLEIVLHDDRNAVPHSLCEFDWRQPHQHHPRPEAPPARIETLKFHADFFEYVTDESAEVRHVDGTPAHLSGKYPTVGRPFASPPSQPTVECCCECSRNADGSFLPGLRAL